MSGNFSSNTFAYFAGSLSLAGICISQMHLPPVRIRVLDRALGDLENELERAEEEGVPMTPSLLTRHER